MACAFILVAAAYARPTRPAVDPFSILSFTWLIGPIIAVVVFAVLFGTVFLPLMRRSAERSRLLKTGEQAQARILGLADTGVKINDNPQIQLALEVYPQSRPPFQTSCIAIVSYLAIPRIQPGMMVPVRFDPADPSKVALEV